MAREEHLQKYAQLAVQVGVNVQQGQTLIVMAPIEAAELVREITKIAYQSGARHVYVDWNDDQLTRTKFQYAPDEALREFPMWKAKGFEEMAENGAAILKVYSSNPDLLNDIDPEKVATANKTSAEAMKHFREYQMKDQMNWSIVAAPNEPWAKKVFPDEDSPVERLWETIFQMTRIDREDPVRAWRDHNDKLREKVAYLNEKKYRKLHYKAPGTDLTIELPERHVWMGGGSKTAGGVAFIPNVPTEEVFTLPHRTGVNGTVSSTKPLNYDGNLIEHFTLTFENGKIVDFRAATGYDTLKHLIETDEGAHYLGEVALVPHDSPISQSGLIFYNTLFDENASCHLAIGKAYPFCLEGGPDMSKEELKENGANDSLTHVDFMIGSADLDIDGITKDGNSEPLFRQGNWAF